VISDAPTALSAVATFFADKATSLVFFTRELLSSFAFLIREFVLEISSN